MIYLVEDDESIRELVIYTLQTTGLMAKGFPCAKDFWNAMKQEYPSLVLLDIMLPDEDGLTILKKLRDNGPTRRLPVIMLTAKGTEYDKVVGLDSGADDYIPKPFGMMELVQSHHFNFSSCWITSASKRLRISLAGVPPTIV